MRTVSRRLLHNALEAHVSPQQLRYKCNLIKLPPEIAERFVELGLDEETVAFIKESERKASNLCLQLLYSCIQLLLGLFMSPTSINGLLHRGRMFVFSSQQLRILLSSSYPIPASSSSSSSSSSRPLLLDIGAGDGTVTAVLQKVLTPSAVYVTESSPVMRKELRKKGHHVLDVQSWYMANACYDVIACLNVLDRCDRPLTLLNTLHHHLRPGGTLLLALVLPYEPFVEKGPFQVSPAEHLPVDGTSWEEEVANLWVNLLQPLGLELRAVTRLPYLCEGDTQKEFYSLDDVALVLRKPLHS